MSDLKIDSETIEKYNLTLLSEVVAESEIDVMNELSETIKNPSDHSKMKNLGFDESGHTGFQRAGNYAMRSELPDLSPFITRLVNDLANYYRKDETYTKAEIQNIVGHQLAYEVVATLPVVNISATTIYLVAKPAAGENVYNEYLYINSSWVLIGTTQVDLSRYPLKSEVYSRSETYHKNDVDSKLSEKQGKSDNGLRTTAKTIVGAINEITPNTLSVDVQGTSLAPNYTFTKANFEAVRLAVQQGAPIVVAITDNRAAAEKPLDLSGIYPAIWNTRLWQVECRELARGFYLKNEVPAHRGAVSNMTAVFYQRDNRFKLNPVTGYYEYFDLLDITENEAINIYNNTNDCGHDINFSDKILQRNQRINFAPKINWIGQNRFYNLSFYGCSQEIIVLDAINTFPEGTGKFFTLNLTQNKLSFYYMSSRKIIGSITPSITSGTFYTDSTPLSPLTEVLFKQVKTNFYAKDLINWSNESIIFLLNNRSGIHPITLTVAPAVFARLTPDIFELATTKKTSILSA